MREFKRLSWLPAFLNSVSLVSTQSQQSFILWIVKFMLEIELVENFYVASRFNIAFKNFASLPPKPIAPKKKKHFYQYNFIKEIWLL